jgi:hypothetical protein
VPHNKLPIGVDEGDCSTNEGKSISFSCPNVVDECKSGVKILGNGFKKNSSVWNKKKEWNDITEEF